MVLVHKKRDIIPLDINKDVEESDEDTEQPVLDFEVEYLVSFFVGLLSYSDFLQGIPIYLFNLIIGSILV